MFIFFVMLMFIILIIDNVQAYYLDMHILAFPEIIQIIMTFLNF